MTSTFKTALFSILILGFMHSCNKAPKVILPTSKSEQVTKKQPVNSTNEQSQHSATSFNDDLHTVIIKEILPASRYVYLKVTEGNEEFWIATRKQKVGIGETYYYKGGLLKTNFESKEHKRMFDKIYLVTRLVGTNHATANSQTKIQNKEGGHQHPFTENPSKKIEIAGSIKIAELVKNQKKYEGKVIQISGKCVKINPNIMGRNWIHLKDGSKDNYDLVVTSNVFIKEGTIVTIKAKVTLHKDFGAGYKYDLILEEGTLVR